MVMQTCRSLSVTWRHRTQLHTVLRLTDSDHHFVQFLRINIEESAVTISPFTNLRPSIAIEYNGNIFFNPVTFLLSRLTWIGRVNRMASKRQVSQVFNNNPQGIRLKGRPKNG